MAAARFVLEDEIGFDSGSEVADSELVSASLYFSSVN